MTLAEQTLTFAAQAPSLPNRKALGASMANLIGMVGARNYACLYLKREHGELVIDRSISNVPLPFLERYLERGYDAADPVFQGVVRAGAHGFWSELTRAMTLDRAGREVMGNARDFDMKEGFTRRIQLDQGGTAVMMVAGEELLRSDRARAALSMSFDVFANVGARTGEQVVRPGLQRLDHRYVAASLFEPGLKFEGRACVEEEFVSLRIRHEKVVVDREAGPILLAISRLLRLSDSDRNFRWSVQNRLLPSVGVLT